MIRSGASPPPPPPPPPPPVSGHNLHTLNISPPSSLGHHHPHSPPSSSPLSGFPSPLDKMPSHITSHHFLSQPLMGSSTTTSSLLMPTDPTHHQIQHTHHPSGMPNSPIETSTPSIAPYNQQPTSPYGPLGSPPSHNHGSPTSSAQMHHAPSHIHPYQSHNPWYHQGFPKLNTHQVTGGHHDWPSIGPVSFHHQSYPSPIYQTHSGSPHHTTPQYDTSSFLPHYNHVYHGYPTHMGTMESMEGLGSCTDSDQLRGTTTTTTSTHLSIPSLPSPDLSNSEVSSIHGDIKPMIGSNGIDLNAAMMESGMIRSNDLNIKVEDHPLHMNPSNMGSMSSSSNNNSSNSSVTSRPQPARSPYEWMHTKKHSTFGSSQPAPGKTRTRDKYRVVYSDHQRNELELEFRGSRYITIRRKTELAQSLSLSERQVKIWFQNRRAKERKQSKKKGPSEEKESKEVTPQSNQMFLANPHLNPHHPYSINMGFDAYAV